MPRTWITWKLNIVWLFISYEQSSIKGLPDKYSASSEVQQNAGVAIGTVGQIGSVKGVKVLKLLSKFPLAYTVQIGENMIFLKKGSDISEKDQKL